MNCQRIQENLIEYQDGSMPTAEAHAIRLHLSGCPDCRRELAALQEITRGLDALAEPPQPSARLREQFDAMLDAYEREPISSKPFALTRSRIDHFFAALLPSRPVVQFAFSAALLFGGLFAGQHFLAGPATVSPGDAAAQAELAALRAQVNSMGQLVTYSLLQQHSTSERMRTVLATMEVKRPDQQVLADLVGSLAFDPSINVRLSAVEALADHADDSIVRAGVRSLLPRETSPLVQVAIIELLFNTGDEAAKPVFEKLSRDESVDRNVRETARRALALLRLPSTTGNFRLTENSHASPL